MVDLTQLKNIRDELLKIHREYAEVCSKYSADRAMPLSYYISQRDRVKLQIFNLDNFISVMESVDISK